MSRRGALVRRLLDPVYAALQRVRGRARRRARRRAVLAAADAFAAATRTAGSRPAGILLLERLGDMVAASAVVAELRTRYPGRRFAWFGRARYRDVALLVPEIDDFIAVECYGELADVVPALADWQLFDLNLNGKTCACCPGAWQNLAGTTQPDTADYYDCGPLAQAFAVAGGLPWRERAPELGSSGVRSPRSSGRPYVVVHSESEESARNWCDEGWRELVATLLEESRLDVVHVGMTRARWLPADPRVEDLAAGTSVLELIELVRGAALFIGIDSSVAHIANATLRPGLVLLGRYRRFLRYWPYSGHYGRAAGGAFVVRYPSECPYLPPAIVLRALRTVLRRLAGAAAGADPVVGRGGPWDVRAQDLEPDDAGPTAVQDGSCDIAVLALLRDMAPAEAIERWPGAPDELVLVLAPEAFAAAAERHGDLGIAIDELEATGARFAFRRRPDAGLLGALESPRYLRHAGRPVVLDEPLPESVAVLDPGSPPGAADLSALGARWYRWHCRDDAPSTLARLHARVVAELGSARGEALPEIAIEAGTEELRAGVDEVARGPQGGVERVQGWLVLESTGSPPAVVCLAQRQADGRFRPRHLQPYSRLERPDVAQAVGQSAALFSGLRLDVPLHLQGLGPELTVLVLDRARGRWRHLQLPG